MDGLLINTEDLYTACHNILLKTYNAGPMNWTIKSKLQGRPASEAIVLLLNWANIPHVSPAEYAEKLHIIQEEEFRKAAPLPGKTGRKRGAAPHHNGAGNNIAESYTNL